MARTWNPRSRLSVGDSIQLEVRSGLKKIHFTAVVRNLGPDGNGVEFVHMKDEDRERLRRLVRKHLWASSPALPALLSLPRNQFVSVRLVQLQTFLQ